MTRSSDKLSISAWLLGAVLTLFSSPASLSIAQAQDCCQPGAACCYAGSPCCAGHAHAKAR